MKQNTDNLDKESQFISPIIPWTVLFLWIIIFCKTSHMVYLLEHTVSLHSLPLDRYKFLLWLKIITHFAKVSILYLKTDILPNTNRSSFYCLCHSL